MLQVVTFKWQTPGYRSKFETDHVNRLFKMVRKHYSKKFEFVCVTDTPEDPTFDPSIRRVPLWKDHANVQAPDGRRNPSCYRRLKLFSDAAKILIGDRFVSLDLDCVITGDVTPLWDRPDDFVIWGGTNPTNPYNGSMILMNAGARKQVWETFDPVSSPAITRREGIFGSDQAWISYVLGPNEKRFTREEGVYSFRNDIAIVQDQPLPEGAKIVFFHGHIDPWSKEVANLDWIKQHWTNT